MEVWGDPGSKLVAANVYVQGPGKAAHHVTVCIPVAPLATPDTL